MGYPDWIVTASEVAGVIGLLALLFAILYIAHLLHRFQQAGRNGAILATLVLGLVGAFTLAFGLTFLVGETHNDHQSGGAAIGWMMMVGYPALALAGPVALVVWAAALFSGTKAASATRGPGGANATLAAPARRRGRFRDRG